MPRYQNPRDDSEHAFAAFVHGKQWYTFAFCSSRACLLTALTGWEPSGAFVSGLPNFSTRVCS
jgi:hypothetical protein